MTYSQADITKFPTQENFALADVSAFSQGKVGVAQWCCCREKHKNGGEHCFARVGVDNAECIFLNEFRWSPQFMTWHDLLLLLEGHVVHLPAPENHFAKDISLTADIPIFCTGKGLLMYIKNG